VGAPLLGYRRSDEAVGAASGWPGVVDVEETSIGGGEPGLSGGRAKGKKILTGIAVEIHEPKGYGRCRIVPLSDASSASLHAFVSDHVEPGATVITQTSSLDGVPGQCRPSRRAPTRIRRASINRRRDAPGGLGPVK